MRSKKIKEAGLGPFGHCAVALAAKPAAPKAPLGVLCLATEIPDILAVALGYAGIERAGAPLPWSHGLFMSAVWSVAGALLAGRLYRDFRAGVVVGLMVLSHWVLDFISHPIPFSTFSWRTWRWSYGHLLPSDLPLFFAGSPTVGLGLYNSISAIQASILELGMFAVGLTVYTRYVLRKGAARLESS